MFIAICFITLFSIINFYQAPLVLRQFSAVPYRTEANKLENVVQLPLGYMRRMMEGRNITSMQAAAYSASKLTADRPNQWAFHGMVHGNKERTHAITTFWLWEPRIIDAELSPSDALELYNSSKFVLIGRDTDGVNLDSHRVYEAIIGGAIPM
jgi:hypothetical protein